MWNIRPFILLVGVLIVTASAAGGCGNSDGQSGAAGSESASADQSRGESGDGGSEGSVSKTEFVNQANAICSQRLTEILARTEIYVRQNVGGGGSESELQAESIDTIFVPAVEREVEEIRELEPPAGDEDKIEAFLESMEKGVELTKAKDYTAKTVIELGREFFPASALAKRYGLRDCSLGWS